MSSDKTMAMWSEAQEDTELKSGWPGWETVRLIGRGSFGSVYEIRRSVFGEEERAALKVISIPKSMADIEDLYSDGYDEKSVTETFQRHLKSIVAEYSLMRRLNGSANVVKCDDVRYIQHDNGIGWDIFIKMELLTPLAKTLPEVIPEAMVVKLAKDMCAALEMCKMHEIIHRDIKPQNIFVSQYGDYKLGDFGIAKTVEKTSGGTKIGTYKYMAPEVFNNQPYGSAADIYSLGLVLYWMLNRRRMPFLPLPPAKIDFSLDEKARQRRLSGEKLPPPADGSPRLKQIVMKACAYDPKDRYASAAEMRRDLNSIVTETVLIRPDDDYTDTAGYHPDDQTVLLTETAKTPDNTHHGNNSSNGSRKKKRILPWILGLVAAAAVAVVVLLAAGKFLVPAAHEEKTPVYGWQSIDGKTYYYDTQGQAISGCMAKIGEATYYFDADGVMQTGWHTLDGKIYYFATDGVMQIGWYQQDDAKYCFGPDGAAVKDGITDIDGEVYAFDADGVMQIGWYQQGDAKYYFGPDGVAARGGIVTIDGENYGFDADGRILTGQHEIDGKACCFDESGICRIVITAQPEDCVVPTGEKTKITVEAQGEGLNYTWWASDIGDTTFYQSPTIVTNTYSVVMEGVRNGRQVYCVITDQHGNTLQTQTVTMKAK